MLSLLGLPAAASAHAGDVDHLIVLVHWLMLLLFVGWAVFFVLVLVRYRKGANPVANYHGTRGALSKWVEIGLVLAEVVLLVVYAVPAWARRVAAPPADAGTTEVRIVAEQFAWNIHYPGPDGRFGRTDLALITADNPLGLDREDPLAADDIFTINEFYFPVGKPVVAHLSSKDVIHSFSLPQMRIKQDTIPGMTVTVWFVPTETTPEGESWEINCSQLCGLGHYRMRGLYRSMSQEAFTQFMEDEQAMLQAS